MSDRHTLILGHLLRGIGRVVGDLEPREALEAMEQIAYFVGLPHLAVMARAERQALEVPLPDNVIELRRPA